MAKAFFHKHGVSNRLAGANGVPFPFEKLSDNQGVIALNTEAKDVDPAQVDAMIADLKAWQKKKLGGVTEIDEQKYEDLKKNLPLPVVVAKANPNINLFTAETSMDRAARAQDDKTQEAARLSAQPAAAPVAAKVVEAKSLAELATDAAKLDSGEHIPVEVLPDPAVAQPPKHRVGPAKPKVPKEPKPGA